MHTHGKSFDTFFLEVTVLELFFHRKVYKSKVHVLCDDPRKFG